MTRARRRPRRRRGRAAALPRDGRIRRNGLCRVPAPAERPDGPGRARGRARPPRRRRADRGRRGGTHGCRGPRRGPGDRFHLPRAGSPEPALQRAVNALLPPDVAIRGVRRAPDGFHPRYAARYREYRYTVWNGPRSPLRERQALGVRSPLDIAAMASAASVFEGRHDFSAFGGSGPAAGPDRARGPGPTGGPPGDDRRPGGFLPPGPGAAHGRRPAGGRTGNIGHARASGRRSPDRGRHSTGHRPPRRACASGASSSDGRRVGRQGRRGMSAKTYTPRESEIERRWYVVDATDETLGRLATRIARVLEGKHKPTYAAHLDTGDHVIVLNAARITVTRDKLDVQGLRPPQRLSRRLQGGDPRSPARPPAGGGHPPRREGDAAAQPPGNPDAPEAQGLCGCRAPAPGPEARAAGLIEEP